MITRIFKVTDTGTLMYFLVTVFEDADKPLCDKIGISPGFRIVNRMAGRVVDTFAGYRFDPDGEGIEGQSRKYDPDGTSTAFGLLLTELSDIKKMPDSVDVEQIREFWVTTSRTIFISDSLMETIYDYGSNHLRKCLYSTQSSIHIALIDTASNKVIHDVSSTGDLKYILPEYLWLPVKEGALEYLKTIEICWFMKTFIKPAAGIENKTKDEGAALDMGQE